MGAVEVVDGGAVGAGDGVARCAVDAPVELVGLQVARLGPGDAGVVRFGKQDGLERAVGDAAELGKFQAPRLTGYAKLGQLLQQPRCLQRFRNALGDAKGESCRGGVRTGLQGAIGARCANSMSE